MKGTTLEIMDPYQRFYTKKDWSKDVMGVMLLQADGSVEAINAEAQKKAGAFF